MDSVNEEDKGSEMSADLGATEQYDPSAHSACSEQGMEYEVCRLRKELSEAYSMCSEKQSDLTLAAELGKTLLENNKKLQEQYDESTQEWAKKVEELEQGNFILRNRIEDNNNEFIARVQDIEKELSKKKQMCDELEKENVALKESKNKAINGLNIDLKNMTCDFEKEGEKVRELTAKLKRCDEKIADMKMQLEEQDSLCSKASEGGVLEFEAKMRSLNERFDSEVNFLKDAISEKEMKLSEEEKKCTRLADQLERSEEQLASVYSSLKEQRALNEELKMELEDVSVVKAESEQKQHTSLFNEVEDKRKELESGLISLKIKYETLLKTYELSKQQQSRLKAQIAGLLQIKGTNADNQKLQKVTQQLKQSDRELESLKVKYINVCKKWEASQKNFSEKLKEYHQNFSNFGEKKAYVEYLEEELKEKDRLIQDARKEVEDKVFLLSVETDKVRKLEKQIFQQETKFDKTVAENMHLKLRMQDMKSLDRLPSIDMSTAFKPSDKVNGPIHQAGTLLPEPEQSDETTSAVNGGSKENICHDIILVEDDTIQIDAKEHFVQSESAHISPENEVGSKDVSCDSTPSDEMVSGNDPNCDVNKENTCGTSNLPALGANKGASRLKGFGKPMKRSFAEVEAKPKKEKTKIINVKEDKPGECTQQ
eukprot:Nk52_evm41s240 gene=Nk52_evmTU41s240